MAFGDVSHLVIPETVTKETKINSLESDSEEGSDSSLDLHTPLL
jgi:hypothetical protein